MKIFAKLWAVVPWLFIFAACGISANRTNNASLHRAVASPLAGQTKEVTVPTGRTINTGPSSPALQTNQVNLNSTAAHSLWVADHEEVLKRLLLVQQDVQKIYEAMAAPNDAWSTWWDILENDWHALCMAIKQNSAVFSSPSRIVQDNLDYAKILDKVAVAQNRLENMADTLSAGQNLDAKDWPKLGEVFALIANSLYVTPSSSDNLLRPLPQEVFSTNQNINLAPSSSAVPEREEAAEDDAAGTPPDDSAESLPAEARPGALAFVGFIL